MKVTGSDPIKYHLKFFVEYLVFISGKEYLLFLALLEQKYYTHYKVE